MKPGSVEYSKDNPVYLTELNLSAGDYGSVSKPLDTVSMAQSELEPDSSVTEPSDAHPIESSYILFFQVL